MSELRLYLRRDSFLEGTDCAWALLDDEGHVQSSGTQLTELPRARRCHLVLAGDLVLTIAATLPDLPERRLAPLLPAAAEASTLMEADAIHAVVMDRTRDAAAILAVVEDAWLNRVLGKLAALGIHPDGALPEYLLLPQSENQWSVCWRSANSLARFNQYEGIALDDGDPPIGLGLALHQRGQPAAIQVYSSEDAGSPTLDRWRTTLNTSIESAGAWDWRTASWPDIPGLLQGKYAPGLKRTDWSRFARPVMWGLIALAAIQVAGVALDWALLSREQSRIRHEMRVLAEQSLPANSAIVDPAWQVTEHLQAMRAASGKAAATNSLIGLLGRLSQIWPKFGNMHVQSLNYASGSMSATVANADAAWLDQLRAAASAQGLAISSHESKDDSKATILTIQESANGGSHGQ